MDMKIIDIKLAGKKQNNPFLQIPYTAYAIVMSILFYVAIDSWKIPFDMAAISYVVLIFAYIPAYLMASAKCGISSGVLQIMKGSKGVNFKAYPNSISEAITESLNYGEANLAGTGKDANGEYVALKNFFGVKFKAYCTKKEFVKAVSKLGRK